VSIESELLDCMLRLGLSDHRSKILAADWAAVLGPMLERERAERAVRDLFYVKPRVELAQQLGIHRSTVYRRHEKLSQAQADDATKVA